MGERVIKKIDTCGKRLIEWSKTCFQNVRRELEKKKKKENNLPRPRD